MIGEITQNVLKITRENNKINTGNYLIDIEYVQHYTREDTGMDKDYYIIPIEKN